MPVSTARYAAGVAIVTNYEGRFPAAELHSYPHQRVIEMSVDRLIAEVVPILADEVFAIATRLRTPSPMFRLKFWYYDTCAPCCYFLAHGLTASERDDILRYDGINAGSNLWNRMGSIEFDVGDLSERETPSKALMAKAYEYMAMDSDERNAAGLTADALVMSRLIAQSLSWHLNQVKWQQVCSVTDDFIVYAQNGTDYGCDCYEDIVASVPGQKLELLRSRGFLGLGERYSNVAAGTEKRPQKVWVNSYQLHGNETNAEEYLKRVRSLCPSVQSAELLPQADGTLVVTLSHETLDDDESDVLDRLATEVNIEIGKRVPRTDIWG
jgi:hypothetical protein